MNKYQVTRESGATEIVEAVCHEFDWKSKNLSGAKDLKKNEAIAYLSRVIKIEEIK